MAREFIEILSLSEFRLARGIGKYIKAFALKYGVSELGYRKETDEAIEFIRRINIPLFFYLLAALFFPHKFNSFIRDVLK